MTVRKQVQIALAVLLVAIAMVIAWGVLGEREPVYQGKSASYWMNYDYRVPNPEQKFREVWKGLGSNAVPFLVKALDRRDAYRPITYRSLVRALPPRLRSVVPTPSPPAIIVRSRAASALGLLGNFSRPAIPALLRTVKTDEEINVRIVATDALSQIRVKPQLVVPLLEIPLSDADFAVRCAAVRALETFGADAQQAVPALVLMLSDSDEDVRLDATNALKAIDPEAAAKVGVQ